MTDKNRNKLHDLLEVYYTLVGWFFKRDDLVSFMSLCPLMFIIFDALYNICSRYMLHTCLRQYLLLAKMCSWCYYTVSCIYYPAVNGAY